MGIILKNKWQNREEMNSVQMHLLNLYRKGGILRCVELLHSFVHVCMYAYVSVHVCMHAYVSLGAYI